jgi:hypothetical protein
LLSSFSSVVNVYIQIQAPAEARAEPETYAWDTRENGRRNNDAPNPQAVHYNIPGFICQDKVTLRQKFLPFAQESFKTAQGLWGFF